MAIAFGVIVVSVTSSGGDMVWSSRRRLSCGPCNEPISALPFEAISIDLRLVAQTIEQKHNPVSFDRGLAPSLIAPGTCLRTKLRVDALADERLLALLTS